MLDGVVPFPPEFAARYRQKGYWEDRPLRDVFAEICSRYSTRVDGDQTLMYAKLDARSTHLALNLLDLGFKPLDRIVVFAISSLPGGESVRSFVESRCLRHSCSGQGLRLCSPYSSYSRGNRRHSALASSWAMHRLVPFPYVR
jgi:acyl-CoA synthetase (AMP-forming)/AMP-acid ligase II